MNVTRKLPLSVQSPVGQRLGRTRVVEAEKISFEIDLVIPKGIECPFQLELPDDGEMVTGIMRIQRVRPKRGPTLPRYLAEILEMSQRDRERLAALRSSAEVGRQSQTQGRE